MQHILAAAITKILDQKSGVDTNANLQQLIMNEIKSQMKDEPEKSLKIQASQKLIETLKNNESLNKSLSRNSVMR
jgi:hypothetical protein